MIKIVTSLPQYVLGHERELTAALDHFFARPNKTRAKALEQFVRSDGVVFFDSLTDEQADLVGRFIDRPY